MVSFWLIPVYLRPLSGPRRRSTWPTVFCYPVPALAQRGRWASVGDGLDVGFGVKEHVELDHLLRALELRVQRLMNLGRRGVKAGGI
jgi:hypothetical protein